MSDDSCLNDVPVVLYGGGAVGDRPDCRVGGREDPRGDVQSSPLHHRLSSVGVEQSLVGDVAVVQSDPGPLLPPGALPPTFKDELFSQKLLLIC